MLIVQPQLYVAFWQLFVYHLEHQITPNSCQLWLSYMYEAGEMHATPGLVSLAQL